MRTVKTSSVRLRRRSRLWVLAPERREMVVSEYLIRGLREIFPDVALAWVAVSHWSARDRSAGFRVEVVAHLPGRWNDVDLTDRATSAWPAESQMTAAILPLCRRVWTAQINIELDSTGERYCVATLWVDTLHRHRRV